MTKILDISIVIVSWNVQDLLVRCLKSIIDGCDIITYEIVVIDNASSDNTVEIVQTNYPQVKLIANQENVGFAVANNQGFRIAQGRYILILNPDTLIEAGSLEYLTAELNRSNDIGAITAKVTLPNGNVQRSCVRKESTLWNSICDMWGLARLFPNLWIFSGTELPLNAYSYKQDVKVMSGAFMLVRKDILDAVDGFDEQYFMYYEDNDLCHRIRRAKWRLVYDPSVSVTHIGGQSGKQISLNSFIMYLESRAFYFNKYYPHIPMFIVQFVILVYLPLKIIEGIFSKILKRSERYEDTNLYIDLLKWWIYKQRNRISLK